MSYILRILSWNRTLNLSIFTLGILIVFSFYGLYTNKFYFFKFDNYIFPLLTVVHFVFIYVVQFKIKEQEFTDPQMRNLEYALYVIFLVYIFKIFDVLFTLFSYNDYDDHVIPDTFMPIGILMLFFHIFLFGLTLITFKHRKELVGDYNFENINGNIDSWQ
ncbi:MAG: hypothetical protein WBG90_18000 [Saonia sp.]